MSTLNPLAKIGKKVSFDRRMHGPTNGVVADVTETDRGHWVSVNIGDKKNPHLVKVRPSQLSKPI